MKAKPKPVKETKSRKHKKKSSRQLLEIELDRTAREIVFLRDDYCVCPAPDKGHSTIMQPGHLITRGKESVKWSLWNLNKQCSSCNLLHEFYPERYTAWFLTKFGAEEYARLVEESRGVTKLSIDDLYELRNQLQEIHALQLTDKTFKPRFSQKQILTGEWRTLRGIEVMVTYRIDNYAEAA